MTPQRFAIFMVDLDGTLLCPAGEVSRRNRKAIDAIRATGAQVVVATGRALHETIPSLEAIGHDGMVIAASGSLLCNSSGETMARRAIPRELVGEAAKRIVGHGHRALLLKDRHATGYDYLAVGNAPMDPASAWWFEKLPVIVREVEHPEEDPDPDDTVRIGAVAEGAVMEKLVDELNDLREEAHMLHWPAVTAQHAIGSPTHLLEMFTAKTDKWSMLADWCLDNGVATDAVVAIGDGENDVEMVRCAGLGIAMGNAIDAVKTHAHRVTGHHADDGFADAIGHILEGRW